MIKWVITRKNSIKFVKLKDHNDDWYMGDDLNFYRKSRSFNSEKETPPEVEITSSIGR